MKKKLLGVFIILSAAIYFQQVKAYQRITLEDIYLEYKFYPKLVQSPYILKDGLKYVMLENEKVISLYNLSTGEKIKELFNAINSEETSNLIIEDFELSPDEKKILIYSDVQLVYRHSYVVAYLIYDIQSGKINSLHEGYQEYATFSPDGKKIAFVVENNIYIRDFEKNQTVQVTFDGKRNEIINGKSDWVYEEEFGSTCMFEWSPNSDYIAFARFDESMVKMYKLIFYNEEYPEWFEYKYPLAGEKNSEVSIHCYHIATQKTIKIDVGQDIDQYIPIIKWSNIPNTLSCIRLNRIQNRLDILLADANSGISRIMYTETSETYISKPSSNLVTFIHETDEVIIMSEKDGYNHLYLYNTKGDFINRITTGNWEVKDILGYNKEKKTVYYTSNEESATQLHFYSIYKNGKSKKKLTNKPGYNFVRLSKSGKYYLNIFSTANSPMEYTLYSIDGKIIRILEKNDELKNRLEEYGFSKKEFINIPTENGILMNAYMIKPYEFDSLKKYPVLVYNYGGPEVSTVIDAWDAYLPWFQYLTQQGVVIVCVENRGSEGRGVAYKKCTYGQLGKLETADLINTAKYLGSLSYIDASRIGIFGWSYGGYTTLLSMTLGADYYKLGIAVAPISSWKFYDSIYAERYLGLPQDNPKGYDEYAPLNLASLLKGKLLLIHGEVDDNVHYQNTAAFINQLIKEGKQFEMQIYPNKNHHISGYATYYHLFTRMSQFIIENL